MSRLEIQGRRIDLDVEHGVLVDGIPYKGSFRKACQELRKLKPITPERVLQELADEKPLEKPNNTQVIP